MFMNILKSEDKLYYVGGCVRDEILGVKSLDIDICYEGDAVEFVKCAGLDILKTQDNIRTARVLLDGKEIDIASTRTEVYPKQGHLPVVKLVGCSLSDDLSRRDFTVNSIAKSVKTGEIVDITGGLEDLKNKILRVHHNESFKDDPTRILRGLKFSLRFGFKLEEVTRRLQEEYLDNVNYDMSYSRLKKELVDTFNLNLQEGLNRFVDEKMYKLLSPKEVELPKENIQKLLEEFPVENPWIVYLGGFDLSRLELTKEEKKIVNDYKSLSHLPLDVSDFELYKVCKKMDIKSILLWIANSDDLRKNKALRYLRDLRHITLEITGDDLIALGYSGKSVGELMDSVLRYKLETPQMTKDDELMYIKKGGF